MPEKINKSATEWRQQLDQRDFEITRNGDTEPPFTGKYNNHKADGAYLCKCCGATLFSSSAKYDSGSGWPSFYQPAIVEALNEIDDQSLGMQRTEVTCARCDAHLGHVFNDGPEPTGLRYCINSASLDFVGDK